MNIDYSLEDITALDEFTGHCVRDFLGKTVNLSYVNIEFLTKKYCNILLDIFDIEDRNVVFSNFTKDNLVDFRGVINLNNKIIPLFFDDILFKIRELIVVLKVSREIGEIFFCTGNTTHIIYDYFFNSGKCNDYYFKDGVFNKREGIVIINNMFRLSSEDANFTKYLERLRMLYES